MKNTLLDLVDTGIKIYFCLVKDFPIRLALCDINIKDMPESTQFPHPIGITIRGGTKIGEKCIIRQNLTVGDRWDNDECAIIGNRVNIGANVTILGPVKIGNDVTISGGAIVLENIPDNTTYVSKIDGNLLKKKM